MPLEPKIPTPTAAVEDYAKAIYALSHDGRDAVATTALAERLGVTPASASAMVKRLDEMGLARHAPYHGIGPGAEFEIVDKQPFGGPSFARFGDDVHVLGGELAGRMRVEVER